MYDYLSLAGLQLVGGFQQADIIRQNGHLQNDIGDMNARFAELDAYEAERSGYGNAAHYESSVNQTIGATRTAYAGENVDVKYGTAGDVERDNRVAGGINALHIKQQAEAAAVGYKTQAINMRLGGQMASLQAGLDAASTQGSSIFNAAKTIVGGYAYDESTGKGTSSRTGTDAKPVFNKGVNIHATNSGDGVRAPSSVDDSGWGWYPDPSSRGNSGQPGFFGHAPREAYSSKMDESYARYNSFTGETGG